MDTITPDWASLPEHLLALISKRLPTRIDTLRFRAVCRSFRSTLPRPSKVQFPQTVLKKTDFLRGPNPDNDDLFFLIESTVYAIQPINSETSQTWVVKVEESKPGRVQILDPLSSFHLKNLSKQLPKSLNLLDYRFTEINKSYVLESAAIRKGKAKVGMCPLKPPIVGKVIFTSLLDESESGDGFAVLLKFGRKLVMWRNVDKKWSYIDTDFKDHGYFDDVIYHNNKFYALASTGLTITVDSKSLTVTHVAAGLQEDLDFWILYLVGSFKDLFMIAEFDNYGDDQYYFIVFKLDEEKCKWVRVVDGLELEDIALFVGGDSSYSVSAKEVSGCKGNCVYYTGDSLKYNVPGEDAWIYDLNNGKAAKLSDFPGYSNLFWPPPSWLKPHSSSAE